MHHKLGCAPDPDDDDLYLVARQFPLTYDPDDDPEVQEETAKMKEELAKGIQAEVSDTNVDAVSSGASDTESETDGHDGDNTDSDQGEVDVPETEFSAGSKSKKTSKISRKKTKKFSVIDKVCHTTSSIGH